MRIVKRSNEREGASSEQHVHVQTRVCVVTVEESAKQRKRRRLYAMKEEIAMAREESAAFLLT